MYQGATFTFSQPFCDCKELRMGWGITMSNGAPCMAFQCQTCLSVLTIPLPNLGAGFEFKYLPAGVKIFVGGEEQKKEAETDSPSQEIQQRDNLIVGPWAGSMIPPIEKEDEE